MKKITLLLVTILLLSGCGATMKSKEGLVAPTPAADMTGQFVSPFKRDGSITEWAEKSWSEEVSKNIAGNVAESAGANLGAKLGGSWGSLLGGAASKVAARKGTHQAFLSALGGEDYIRKTSDLSFNSLDALSQYMFIENSSHKQYKEALNSVMYVYPELEEAYEDAIDRL